MAIGLIKVGPATASPGLLRRSVVLRLEAAESTCSTAEDKLFGYGGADFLFGERGSDTIDGRLGKNTLVLSDKRSEYTLTTEDYNYVASHTGGSHKDGTDTFHNIEVLKFPDQSVSPDDWF